MTNHDENSKGDVIIKYRDTHLSVVYLSEFI